jgi:hypothetical protein
MKYILKKRDISFVPRLTKAIKELWTMGLSWDYLKNLSNSVTTVLQMVIAAIGDMTKY